MIMNKLFSKFLILLVVIAMLTGCLAACVRPDDNPPDTGNNDNAHKHSFVDGVCDCGESDPDYQPPHEHNFVNGKCECGTKDPNYKEEIEFVDYASQVKFNPNSGKIYAEVTVKSYIDGDTTHFFIEKIHGGSGDTIPESYVKARYLGINTPESTGVIEPWGKKASNYTKAQLMKATDIIIESDTATWNLDSTGGRYLLWVWYKTADDTEYRNLNLEILQQGLAYGSNVTSNTYGEYALAALNQAKAMKLHVFNKAEKDPDYYYGGAVSLTLKELKASTVWDAEAGRHQNKYEGKLVKFEAVVAKQIGPTIYVEEYDAENDMYFGMQIFAGYSYPKMDEFVIGNRLSIVGTLQYYENGGTYQVSNLKYKILDPEWEGGCRVISTGHSASFTEIDVNTLMNGTITLDVFTVVEDENGEMIETSTKQVFDYGELAHYSTATVKNLTVQSVYTTTSDTDSNGALTITCKDENGVTIKIRTASKLIHNDNTVVVASDFPKGTVISVKGVIDSFNGEYQIKVFNINDITFE